MTDTTKLREHVAEEWENLFDVPIPENADIGNSLNAIMYYMEVTGRSCGWPSFGDWVEKTLMPVWYIRLSDPVLFGEHPNLGGGRKERDVEIAWFDGACGLSRKEWMPIAPDVVTHLDEYAWDNAERLSKAAE